MTPYFIFSFLFILLPWIVTSRSLEPQLRLYISSNGSLELNETAGKVDSHPDLSSFQKRENSKLTSQDKATANLQIPLDSHVFYQANITIGTPPQSFSVVVDTTDGDVLVYGTDVEPCSGSGADWSNCVLGTNFDPSLSETFISQTNILNSTFLDGTTVRGSYGVDTLTIGNITINETSIGIISNSSKIIPSTIGLGFTGTTVSKFLNSLLDQQIISSPVFSLFLTSGCYDDEATNAMTSPNVASGSLLLGAVDTSRYNGPLYVIPMVPFSENSTSGGSGGAYRYPSIPLTGLFVSNQDLRANITSSDVSIPVILDSTNVISYLPYQIIVNIATQLNAAYIEEYDIWVQSCSYRDVEGDINFAFNDAVISMPISRTLTELYDRDSGQPIQLNSEGVCALMFASSELSGYNSLGIGVLSSMYIVIDLEQYVVGIAEPADAINTCTFPATSSESSRSTTADSTMASGQTADSTNQIDALTTAVSSLVAVNNHKNRVALATSGNAFGQMQNPESTSETHPQSSSPISTISTSISITINTPTAIAQAVSDNITVISGNLTKLPGAQFITPTVVVTAVISPAASNFTALGGAFPLMAVKGATSVLNSAFPFLSGSFGTPPIPAATYTFDTTLTGTLAALPSSTPTIVAKATRLSRTSCSLLGLVCCFVCAMVVG